MSQRSKCFWQFFPHVLQVASAPIVVHLCSRRKSTDHYTEKWWPVLTAAR